MYGFIKHLFYSKIIMKLIRKYVNKLIKNLPEEITKRNTTIDLVLDGGIFNGSYLIGALYFLKEMENRKYIKVDRMSSCSIGAICSLLYYLNSLDAAYKLYSILFDNFKESYHLEKIKNIHVYLNKYISNDFYLKVNNRLYITYYNIQNGKKIVKTKYKSNEDLIDSIIKSCFFPFLIDGKINYKTKYIDGLNPYIFQKDIRKKILYLDLFGSDKINYILNVRNEKTNIHRILSGLLDIHTFYIKQRSTQMCSYVDEWECSDNIHFFFKKMIEKIILYSVYFFKLLFKLLPYDIDKNFVYIIVSKSLYITYSTFLETYVL
jgi:hypothetical protein